MFVGTGGFLYTNNGHFRAQKHRILVPLCFMIFFIQKTNCPSNFQKADFSSTQRSINLPKLKLQKQKVMLVEAVTEESEMD